MKNVAIPCLSAMALMVSAVCRAQEPSTLPKPGSLGAAPGQPQVEEVIVSVSGLYGDWKMVLPEWPGFNKPVTGDFCNFKKHGDGVSIGCADDFLQQVPDVTLNGDK